MKKPVILVILLVLITAPTIVSALDKVQFQAGDLQTIKKTLESSRHAYKPSVEQVAALFSGESRFKNSANVQVLIKNSKRVPSEVKKKIVNEIVDDVNSRYGMPKDSINVVFKEGQSESPFIESISVGVAQLNTKVYDTDTSKSPPQAITNREANIRQGTLHFTDAFNKCEGNFYCAIRVYNEGERNLVYAKKVGQYNLYVQYTMDWYNSKLDYNTKRLLSDADAYFTEYSSEQGQALFASLFSIVGAPKKTQPTPGKLDNVNVGSTVYYDGIAYAYEAPLGDQYVLVDIYGLFNPKKVGKQDSKLSTKIPEFYSANDFKESINLNDLELYSVDNEGIVRTSNGYVIGRFVGDSKTEFLGNDIKVKSQPKRDKTEYDFEIIPRSKAPLPDYLRSGHDIITDESNGNIVVAIYGQDVVYVTSTYVVPNKFSTDSANFDFGDIYKTRNSNLYYLIKQGRGIPIYVQLLQADGKYYYVWTDINGETYRYAEGNILEIYDRISETYILSSFDPRANAPVTTANKDEKENAIVAQANAQFSFAEETSSLPVTSNQAPASMTTTFLVRDNEGKSRTFELRTENGVSEWFVDGRKAIGQEMEIFNNFYEDLGYSTPSRAVESTQNDITNTQQPTPSSENLEPPPPTSTVIHYNVIGRDYEGIMSEIGIKWQVAGQEPTDNELSSLYEVLLEDITVTEQSANNEVVYRLSDNDLRVISVKINGKEATYTEVATYTAPEKITEDFRYTVGSFYTVDGKPYLVKSDSTPAIEVEYKEGYYMWTDPVNNGKYRVYVDSSSQNTLLQVFDTESGSWMLSIYSPDFNIPITEVQREESKPAPIAPPSPFPPSGSNYGWFRLNYGSWGYGSEDDLRNEIKNLHADPDTKLNYKPPENIDKIQYLNYNDKIGHTPRWYSGKTREPAETEVGSYIQPPSQSGGYTKGDIVEVIGQATGKIYRYTRNSERWEDQDGNIIEDRFMERHLDEYVESGKANKIKIQSEGIDNTGAVTTQPQTQQEKPMQFRDIDELLPFTSLTTTFFVDNEGVVYPVNEKGEISNKPIGQFTDNKDITKYSSKHLTIKPDQNDVFPFYEVSITDEFVAPEKTEAEPTTPAPKLLSDAEKDALDEFIKQQAKTDRAQAEAEKALEKPSSKPLTERITGDFKNPSEVIFEGISVRDIQNANKEIKYRYIGKTEDGKIIVEWDGDNNNIVDGYDVIDPTTKKITAVVKYSQIDQNLKTAAPILSEEESKILSSVPTTSRDYNFYTNPNVAPIIEKANNAKLIDSNLATITRESYPQVKGTPEAEAIVEDAVENIANLIRTGKITEEEFKAMQEQVRATDVRLTNNPNFPEEFRTRIISQSKQPPALASEVLTLRYNEDSKKYIESFQGNADDWKIDKQGNFVCANDKGCSFSTDDGSIKYAKGEKFAPPGGYYIGKESDATPLSQNIAALNNLDEFLSQAPAAPTATTPSPQEQPSKNQVEYKLSDNDLRVISVKIDGKEATYTEIATYTAPELLTNDFRYTVGGFYTVDGKTYLVKSDSTPAIEVEYEEGYYTWTDPVNNGKYRVYVDSLSQQNTQLQVLNDAPDEPNVWVQSIYSPDFSSALTDAHKEERTPAQPQPPTTPAPKPAEPETPPQQKPGTDTKPATPPERAPTPSTTAPATPLTPIPQPKEGYIPAPAETTFGDLQVGDKINGQEITRIEFDNFGNVAFYSSIGESEEELARGNYFEKIDADKIEIRIQTEPQPPTSVTRSPPSTTSISPELTRKYADVLKSKVKEIHGNPNEWAIDEDGNIVCKATECYIETAEGVLPIYTQKQILEGLPETQEARLRLFQQKESELSKQTVSNFIASIEKALTEFQGLGYLASLFMDQDALLAWRDRVDRIFATFYLGTEYITSSICSEYLDGEEEGIAYAETPQGLAQIAAHVEATKTEPIVENGTTQFIYKITFSVRNGDYAKDLRAPEEMKVNVVLKGQKTVNVFKKDQVIKRGSTLSRAGRNAIVQESPTSFDKICLKFDEIPFKWKISDKEICNKIQASSGTPTFISTPASGTGSGSQTSDDINDF